MIFLKPTFLEIDLQNKKIFLRLDLNVPLKNGIIEDTFRLERSLPTLQKLMKKNAHIVIGTHLGKPNIKSSEYSTRHLLPWLHNYAPVTFALNLKEAHMQLADTQAQKIILLENLRFFPGETTHDSNFAQQLRNLVDYYIFDAFGVAHRKDTSITLLPALLSQSDKSIGLLVEQELSALNKFLAFPLSQRCLIMGGAKISTKLPILEMLLKNKERVAVCPPLSTMFEKAQGKEIGTSLIDKHMIEYAKNILNHYQHHLVLPVDYIVQDKSNFVEIYSDTIEKDMNIISLGTESLKNIKNFITDKKALFFNGAMGFIDQPETLHATQSLLEIITTSQLYTVAGGGDTIATIHKLRYASKINFLSTGGGATLAYLAHQKLPGLISINE